MYVALIRFWRLVGGLVGVGGLESVAQLHNLPQYVAAEYRTTVDSPQPYPEICNYLHDYRNGVLGNFDASGLILSKSAENRLP